MNILLVEDNESIARGLKYSFEKNNYVLTWKASAREVREYLAETPKIDLVILDVMLPDGDGFTIYENSVKKLDIPTIFLTAKDDEDDVVKGLNIGAEDYITKPFSTKELLARVNKTLLRYKKSSRIVVQDITFDADKMVVYKNDEVVELTPLEIKLLSLLFLDIGKVVRRSVILDTIWDSTGNDVDDHTVTVYFKRIREKLGTNIITTVKGLGYRIDEE